jgi:hypothetical protein
MMPTPILASKRWMDYFCFFQDVIIKKTQLALASRNPNAH